MENVNSLDDLVIHLGTSDEINRELRIEAESINSDHANVQVAECNVKPQPNGMMEICGCFVEYNGEIVAKGCKEVGEWLNAYHRRRAEKRLLSQVIPSTGALVGAGNVFAH